MPSDAYREARAAAKEARAAAKRARRRWLDLRPWYFKKRFLLGFPILLAMAAAVAFITISLEYGDSSPGTVASDAPAATAGVARIGSASPIGEIDLTVLAFEAFDGRTVSPANDATHRLRFSATNSRGPSTESYRLVDDAFQLIDSGGVMQGDWHAVCQNCPDALGTGVSLALNASIEGVVYFRIPTGQTAATLEYRAPGSATTGRVALQ
ncbi:MAG: hypothetical protein AB7I38_05165 [Dehalococcoidia bacterium]